MPRGRHRHSPPLHRLLPPSAIAGVALVCALGPWVSSEPMVLRLLAAVAAATAFVGAAVMRRWDAQAGKQVADLTRARTGDEWRYEERAAELETDLEESRELRAKLEQRLRAKRAELAGLRNEHAALLRRYATAETERATALEGRRLLEIEAVPSHALPAVTQPETGQPATARADAAASEAGRPDGGKAADEPGTREAPEAEAADEKNEADEAKPAAPGAFSPAGSQLFLRAQAALSRLADGDEEPPAESAVESAAESGPESAADPASPGSDLDTASEPASASVPAPRPAPEPAPKGEGAADGVTNEAEAAEARPSGGDAEHVREPAAESVPEDEAQGQPEAVAGHEHAAAAHTPVPAASAKSAQQPSGHFTVPTAVAVVPPAPARPAVEGGFDFFGTQKDAASAPLDAVQNEDLADVVGQEALALHKSESDGEFKPAGEKAHDAGEVIDLTAHDETEHIELPGLRSAAS
ncbi:hypothetical protein ACIQGO_08595 [Streptomyces shenzhenensis]|uniref:hypothetical protein n=1 Tax=Streptomyces shenzhenensis TaxID=943815 RepID=UPI0037FA3D30